MRPPSFLYRFTIGVLFTIFLGLSGTAAFLIWQQWPMLSPFSKTVAFLSNPPSPTLIPTAVPLEKQPAQQHLAMLPLVIAPATPTPILPTPTPRPTPRPLSINNVPRTKIIIMSPQTRANVREIFLVGQKNGRNPNAFARVGDSTIDNRLFLSHFDHDVYHLGEYAMLQSTINQFSGSFDRDSVAVRKGLHSWTALDPLWADKSRCKPNETPVGCEIRLQNPAILLIRLGANDSGVPDYFEQNLRNIVHLTLENGVIPVLGTKADRVEGNNSTNEIIRRVAADLQIPLWDFDHIAATLPRRGLDQDFVHMTTFYPPDYRNPVAFERGHSVHNLTALVVLDTIWYTIEDLVEESSLATNN